MSDAVIPVLDLAGPSPRVLLRRRAFGHAGLMFGTVLLVLIIAHRARSRRCSRPTIPMRRTSRAA